ncbi:ankyrin repeat domain-containing protein 17-like [Haliotis rubra]|uniref:ankyrin repeat domain-containing protein 17-like n=1 Tax=Haliotis rubra TaxID=36100 RepID=UPI001EE566F6|nr:ankyrin repeat domain-containing protein 17-like [Haliotis rubra]
MVLTYCRHCIIASTDQKQNDPEKSPQHKVDMQETFANSQLHEACRKGDLDRVRHILSQGLVDINSRDKKHGRTALMVAAQTGHCRVSDFHISKGATISDLDKACKNVLHWACKGGHVGMVKRVLPQYRYGKRGRCPTLLQAAMRGHRDVFEFLVCTGRSVSEVDGVGSNVLHYACRGGQLAMVKYLVSQGSVDINSSNRDRITALMMAALRGKTDVIKFLISMGANVSHVDIMGNNVLTLAIIKTHLAVVKYLVSQSSVDINGVRRSGRTPLMTAVSSGDKDVFDFLVKKGS